MYALAVRQIIAFPISRLFSFTQLAARARSPTLHLYYYDVYPRARRATHMCDAAADGVMLLSLCVRAQYSVFVINDAMSINNTSSFNARS